MAAKKEGQADKPKRSWWQWLICGIAYFVGYYTISSIDDEGKYIGTVLIVAALMGLACGCIPYFVGRARGRKKLGGIGFAITAALGFWYGIIAGAISALIFTVILLVLKAKPEKDCTQQKDVGNAAPAADTETDSPTMMDSPTIVDSSTVEDYPDYQCYPDTALELECHGGYLNGRHYFVPAEGITIGRTPDNTICYPAQTPGISRHHAKLFWQKGQLMLVDLGSSNGTYLYQTGRIVPMQPVPLNPGDVFYLGEKLNAFEIN